METEIEIVKTPLTKELVLYTERAGHWFVRL